MQRGRFPPNTFPALGRQVRFTLSQEVSTKMLADVLIRRLQVHNTLDADDIKALQNLAIDAKELPVRATIVREGERPSRCCVLLEGFICRTRDTPDGKRQILSLHVPGDIPDLQSLHLQVLDHDI